MTIKSIVVDTWPVYVRHYFRREGSGWRHARYPECGPAAFEIITNDRMTVLLLTARNSFFCLTHVERS